MVFRSRVTGNVLPNARRVSVAIHSEAEGPETDPNVHQLPNMSIVAMTFAQFLDHDLTLTPGYVLKHSDTLSTTTMVQ